MEVFGICIHLLLSLALFKDKQRLLRRPRWKKKARAWMLKAEVASESCDMHVHTSYSTCRGGHVAWGSHFKLAPICTEQISSVSC